MLFKIWFSEENSIMCDLWYTCKGKQIWRIYCKILTDYHCVWSWWCFVSLYCVFQKSLSCIFSLPKKEAVSHFMPLHEWCVSFIFSCNKEFHVFWYSSGIKVPLKCYIFICFWLCCVLVEARWILVVICRLLSSWVAWAPEHKCSVGCSTSAPLLGLLGSAGPVQVGS